MFIMITFCCAKKSHLVTPITHLSNNTKCFPIREAQSYTSQTPQPLGQPLTNTLLVHEEHTPVLPIETRVLPFYARKPLILHHIFQKAYPQAI